MFESQVTIVSLIAYAMLAANAALLVLLIVRGVQLKNERIEFEQTRSAVQVFPSYQLTLTDTPTGERLTQYWPGTGDTYVTDILAEDWERLTTDHGE